jgi:hypothetical protein
VAAGKALPVNGSACCDRATEPDVQIRWLTDYDSAPGLDADGHPQRRPRRRRGP